jgi:transcriptional regulator with XRE-family HTH domain
MKKLIEYRALKGISQKDLALASKINQSVISRIEKGVTEGYSVMTMKALADVLGVSPLEIEEFAVKLRAGGSPKETPPPVPEPGTRP